MKTVLDAPLPPNVTTRTVFDYDGRTYDALEQVSHHIATEALGAQIHEGTQLGRYESQDVASYLLKNFDIKEKQ